VHRFLVPGDLLLGDSATLEGATARQISVVLRLRPGERVTLIDGQGSEAECVLTAVSQRQATIQVLDRTRSTAEPALRIHLYPALLRGPRFELVLQKATELGVSAITPVLAERSVARPAGDAAPERWKSIVREAVEQSGRGRLPALQAPIAFQTACTQARQADLALCCSEHGGVELRTLYAQGVPRTLAVLIGPEGGLTPGEVEGACQAGLQAVTLGPRILRAETAAMAVCAAALCLSGDWR
jgi:16S rRNA (uracil1498-N3)-methyltransferase